MHGKTLHKVYHTPKIVQITSRQRESTRVTTLGFDDSGFPLVKPIGLRCVYELYRNFDLPIVGVGGITDWRDAVEYVLAGASCVQVGTGITYRGLKIFEEINEGICRYFVR